MCHVSLRDLGNGIKFYCSRHLRLKKFFLFHTSSTRSSSFSTSEAHIEITPNRSSNIKAHIQIISNQSSTFSHIKHFIHIISNQSSTFSHIKAHIQIISNQSSAFSHIKTLIRRTSNQSSTSSPIKALVQRTHSRSSTLPKPPSDHTSSTIHFLNTAFRSHQLEHPLFQTSKLTPNMSPSVPKQPAVNLLQSTQEDVKAYLAGVRLASSNRIRNDAEKARLEREKRASPVPEQPAANMLRSTQEDVKAYLAGIRLASSIRVRKEAEKARLEREKRTPNPDSWGRHHPSSPSTNVTTPQGPEPIPALNQTSPPSWHTLATRNTAMCEAPLGFQQYAACARLELWIALAIIFALVVCCFIRIKPRKLGARHCKKGIESTTWPWSLSRSTSRPLGRPKNIVPDAPQEMRDLEEEIGVQQYEPVAWRSSSNRALRANVGGIIEHDGGPVTVLPAIEEVMGETTISD